MLNFAICSARQLLDALMVRRRFAFKQKPTDDFNNFIRKLVIPVILDREKVLFVRFCAV